MPAGRDLDALVAEKVFGYCHECVAIGKAFKRSDPEVKALIRTKARYCAVIYVGEEGDLRADGERQWYCGLHDKRWWESAVKPYSTDIVAAWEVVEKFDYHEVYGGNGYWKWYLQHTHADAPGGFGEGEAPLAPLAICRAALKAVGT
jgi:hypothetical protein